MAGFNGAGQFSFTYNWVNDAANGIPITASRMDGQFNDAVSGFDLCLTRDGQGIATALIPFPLGLSTDTLSAYTSNGSVAVTYGQLSFPAVQILSADTHTLDDYREGTFTPTISFGGGSTGITYGVQSGTYTKIGNNINFRLSITLTNKGSSTGNVLISGMPYANSSAFAVAISVRLGGALGSISVCQGYVNSTPAQTITLEKLVAGTASSLIDTDIGNTAQLLISGSY